MARMTITSTVLALREAQKFQLKLLSSSVRARGVRPCNPAVGAIRPFDPVVRSGRSIRSFGPAVRSGRWRDPAVRRGRSIRPFDPVAGAIRPFDPVAGAVVCGA